MGPDCDLVVRLLKFYSNAVRAVVNLSQQHCPPIKLLVPTFQSNDISSEMLVRE